MEGTEKVLKELRVKKRAEELRFLLVFFYLKVELEMLLNVSSTTRNPA